MKSLHLPEWDALIRYHVLPGAGAPTVWLAGLNFSCLAALGHIVGDARLSARPRLLVDYLGTGHSETPPAFPHTMEAHAATVAAILDREGIAGATLVGHSMGGTVGIHLALARPDLVAHLVACEANVEPGGGGMTRRYAAVSEDDFAGTTFPKLMAGFRAKAIAGDVTGAYLAACWQGSDPRGIHRSSVSLVGLPADFRERYLALPMRSTFVYGEACLPERTGGPTPDTPDPELLHGHGIGTRVIPGAGHLMMADNPDGFAAALADLV